MKKSQTPRVQHLPTMIAGCFPVSLVTNDRMTDRMKMDPDLVRSSCEDLAKHESPPARFLDDFEPRLGRSPAFDNSHFLTVNRVATDRFYDIACRTQRIFRRTTPDKISEPCVRRTDCSTADVPGRAWQPPGTRWSLCRVDAQPLAEARRRCHLSFWHDEAAR